MHRSTDNSGFLTAGNGPSPKARARAGHVAPDAPLARGADIAFRLNGEDVLADARRDDHRGRRSPRRVDSAAVLQAGLPAGRQLPRVHGRDQGRARARAVVLPPARPGHGSDERQRPRRPFAEDDRRAPRLRHARALVQERTPSSTTGSTALAIGTPRFARRAAAARRPVASGDGGEPRRLHPVHALRARLPGGAGQRRHRLRVSRRAFEDRVRPRRPDGTVDLRRLRRMRAGLSDRRARAGERGVPASRSTARSLRSVRIAASAARSRTTSRTTASSTSRAATDPRIASGCASRAASASTTSIIPSG